MMNINARLDFLMLKVSDQYHSISNCHDISAKILKRYLCLHIHARHINSNFQQVKQFVGISAARFLDVY